jgi:16S rRNA (cytosine1402-N4)-methyltransferase
MTTQTTYHKSVLVNEVLQYLDPQPGKVYIDATFGGGGHTRAILDKEPNCKVIAFDWDTKALEHGQQMLEQYGERLEFMWGNFASIYMLLKKHKIDRVDGVLADFGTSQTQIFTKDGFSFTQDSFLDMRMSSAHYKTTAAEILNKSSEEKLANIFFELGEEGMARKIAKTIVEERKKKKFKMTSQLVDLIVKIKGPKRGKAAHPATKVFQALRIYVNHELENIECFLQAMPKVLNDAGRVVCISFHSLEDRLVKHFFKEFGHTTVNQGRFEILTPRVVIATPEELAQNLSARSACLRAASYLK